MKQKIKLKALSYTGKVIFFTKDFDCPDFELIPPTNFQGIELPETTVESQVIDWFDDQDKSQNKIKKELSIIIDYWVPKKKQIKPTILDYLKQADLSEQLLLDLIAVYAEIRPLLKGKSIETQIEMLFSHVNIGYKSASIAYKNITDILQAPTVDDARKMLL